MIPEPLFLMLANRDNNASLRSVFLKELLYLSSKLPTDFVICLLVREKHFRTHLLRTSSYNMYKYHAFQIMRRHTQLDN
jgi:hypothetical protein